MGKTDGLSRRLDWKVEVEKGNKIKITKRNDEKVVRVVEEIKKVKVKVLRDDE